VGRPRWRPVLVKIVVASTPVRAFGQVSYQLGLGRGGYIGRRYRLLVVKRVLARRLDFAPVTNVTDSRILIAKRPLILWLVAAVHKKGDSTARYGGADPIEFDLNEFLPMDSHPIFDFQIPGENAQFLWAAKNMMDFQGYDSDTCTKLADLVKKARHLGEYA
jgi:hypothetical protein